MIILKSEDNIRYKKGEAMKKFLALVLLMGLLSTNLFAMVKNIRSSDKKVQVHVARVVKLLNFPKESGVVINIAVVDTGGSTDVSASKDIYFTLYKRGEMFSTDASFSWAVISL